MEAATQMVLAGSFFAPIADSAQPSQALAATLRQRKGKSVQESPTVVPSYRQPAQAGRTMFEPFNLTQNYAPAFLSSSAFPPLIPRLAVSLKKNNRGPSLPQARCEPPSDTGSESLQRQKSTTPTADFRLQPSAQPTLQTSTPIPPKSQLQTVQPIRPKTYREAISGFGVQGPVNATSTEPINLSFSSVNKRKLSSYNGEPALLLSREDEDSFALPFKHTLVGKFSNGKPTMAELRKDIKIAGFAGQVYLGLLDYRHVFFKFEKDEDLLRMWTSRTWNFSGFTARIFRWTTDFRTDIESPVAPVWLTLPQLPLHCFNKEALFAIASSIGTPLKVDKPTAFADKLVRPSEARILVELDVLKERPQRVWIGSQEKGQWQPIVMENSPNYCTNCQKMGHLNTQCNSQLFSKDAKAKRLRKGKGKIWMAKTPVDLSNTSFQGSKETEDLIGRNKNTHDSQKRNAMPSVALEQQNVVDPNEDSVDSNLRQFLANLGQLLAIINREEGKADVLDEQPLAIEYPIEALNAPDLDIQETSKLETTVPTKWEEGESSAVSKASPKLELAISVATPPKLDWVLDAKGIPTLDICDDDPGEVGTLARAEPELGSLSYVQPPLDKIGKGSNKQSQYQFSKSDLEILSNMEKSKLHIGWEDGEPSSVFRVKSTSDLAQLEMTTESEYEADVDGFDRWTENSYEEEPEDAFSQFLSKMEKSRIPHKQTKFSEVLVSPKANALSERKLRERNPFICYSKPKRWNQR